MVEQFSTRVFEISKRAVRGGMRPIKLILHRIMETSDDYQDNGISWREEYVVEAAKTIAPAPIAVEYLSKGETADDTEIGGHGLVGRDEDADGLPMPVYNENSEVVGSIKSAKVTTITLDGKETKVLLADGVLYEQRCKGLVDWLKKNVPLGNVMGSVEIVGLPENENRIVYEDGYKPEGRVPKEYAYSGHAILSASVAPADDASRVLEVNEQNKEDGDMDNEALRTAIEEIKTELHSVFDHNDGLNAEISQLNTSMAEKEIELSEAKEEAAKLQAALDQVNSELTALREEMERGYQERDEKFQMLWAEKDELIKQLTEIRVQKRLEELDAAVAEFSDEEKGYAEAEINAFKADPLNVEINTVTDVIYREIGKQRKVAEPTIEEPTHEQNQVDNEDIFSEVNANQRHIKEDEDASIF